MGVLQQILPLNSISIVLCDILRKTGKNSNSLTFSENQEETIVVTKYSVTSISKW